MSRNDYHIPEIIIALFICITVMVVSYHLHLTNLDENRVEMEIKIDANQRNMEIELHGKRKIWERPMPQENEGD